MLLVTPARAKDHDKDHDWDKKHNKHSNGYYRDRRPSVTIGIASPRQRYYGSSYGSRYRSSYGSSSTVIIARDRPGYYGRESYSGGSIEIDVQRGLSRRGYYRGPIDGDIGPGSRASIRAFQADNGYAPTGRIDRGLIVALR
jgi:hypothetical protein